MTKKRIQPKLENMSEEQLKAWQEKLNELSTESINTHKTTTIKQGRGWIF